MIGKIVTGKSFRGAVEYVLLKEKSFLLDSDGVDTRNARTVTADFNYQRRARPEIKKVVGHISLSFHSADTPRLTDGVMAGLAREYMERMGITDTQYVVARHEDTAHPHLHIVYNRVRYDAKLVPDSNERRRNTAVCKTLKRKYGLTFSEGKENIRIDRLHEPDKTKQEIYAAVNYLLAVCTTGREFILELRKRGIIMTLVHRGNDPDKDIQGATFTKDGTTFKPSQIDRRFSYLKIVKRITENAQKQEYLSQEKTIERKLHVPSIQPKRSKRRKL